MFVIKYICTDIHILNEKISTYICYFDLPGAAISAANELHQIIQEKLMDVINHLLPPLDPAPSSPSSSQQRNQIFWFPEREISVESFIVGALESSFHDMVSRPLVLAISIQRLGFIWICLVL